MQAQLYHFEIKWPEQIPTELYNIPVNPSKHALERAMEKGIQLPSKVTGKAFECELIDGHVTKVAVRCRYSPTHDLCVVLSRRGIIITAWLNHVQDNHGTLDASKYVKY